MISSIREFEEIKGLNAYPNPDEECENRDDIFLLSENIVDSIYW